MLILSPRAVDADLERSDHSWKRRNFDKIGDDALLANELYLLAFATGMQDAATFPDYHCFASNQTGNTVLLFVGVFGLGGDIFSIANIGVSLSFFVVGVLSLGQISNLLGVRKRWWLLLSSLIQTVLVFVAAALQYRSGVSNNDKVGKIIIALLAFSSGGQVAMARSLKITEITTAMATAAYVDILIDTRMLACDNRPRNRRLFFLVSLVAGSFAGAGSYKKLGSPFVLLISAVGKSIVTGLFLFNRRSREQNVRTSP